MLTTPPRGEQKGYLIFTCEILPLEKNNPEVKYTPTRFFGGGVFLGEASCTKKRKRDILLGTWKVRSLYRSRSLRAAARELARYKLDVVGVQEVRWDKGDTYKQGTIFFLWERK
jgi:hypothetical protein